MNLPTIDVVLQQRRQLRHDFQIDPHDVLNPGPLHFDDASFAVDADGAMHLRHRGRADGLRFDRCEKIGVRAAQFRVQHCQHAIKWNGRHFIVQFGQLHDERRRQQQRARGKKLAELDEGRPQFFEGAPQAFGRRKQGDFLLRLAHFAKGQAQRAGQRQPRRQVFVAVFEKHAHDGAEAMHMTHRPPPFCKAT